MKGGKIRPELFRRLKYVFRYLSFQRVIQLNAMEDRVVPDRRSWDKTIEFMTLAIQDRLTEVFFGHYIFRYDV